MTTRIATKIPNQSEYKRSLDSNYSGKWYSFLSLIIGIPFFWLGNNISENPQYITIFIFIFMVIYLTIPASLYMKGYFTFFFNSWLIGLVTLCLFSYTTTLIAYNINIYFDHINIAISIVFIIIYTINLIRKKNKIDSYKSIVRSSIKNKIFYIDVWIDSLRDSEVDQGMDFALLVMLISGGFVILAGTIFGGGLITAKVLLNNGFDIIVEAVMSIGVFMVSMLILSRFTNETLKLMAAYRVYKDLNEEH